MSTRVGKRLAGVAVAGVLALAGCGKEPTPQTQAPPPPPTFPVFVPPTTPAAPPEQPPPTTTGPRPSLPGQGTPQTGFVPPDSPTFTPPGSIGGQPLPGTPPVVPPANPPTNPTPEPPKPADPPKPTDPPKTETPKPETPKPVTYPEKIGGKTLKEWLAELKYPAGPLQKDDQVREAAVKAIPGFGPEAREPAVQPLIDAIREDPDPGVQVAAITVVSNMGFEMRKQVKPVIAVLQNKLGTSAGGNIVKMYCVRSLASFGPDAASAIPYFKNSCQDPSWETRREIAIALSQVGATPTDEKGLPKKDAGPNEKAIEILMDYQLKDKSVAVRMEAAKALLTLGPPYVKDAADFAKHTEVYQKHVDEAVKFESGKGEAKTTKYGGRPDRGMYVWALLVQIMYNDQKIPDNIKELAKLVKEPDGPNADQVRLYALQALGAAGQAFPVLAEVERKVDEKDRAAPKAIAAIIDALQYKHESLLVYTAMNTLAMIGKPADAAIPALQKIADDKPLPPPEGSPKGTPPDDSMQRMARQTIEVLLGRRKFEDYGKEGKDDPTKK